MQVHLLGSIYLGPFWLFFMGLIGLILFGILIFSLIWLFISIIKKKVIFKPLLMTSLSIFLFCCCTMSVDFAEKLVVSQRDYNDDKGAIIVKAVHKFKVERGRYPHTLNELKVNGGLHLPKYKHGFIWRDFIYWNEEDKPILKYCSGMCTGRFYDFNKKIWWNSTL